MSAPKTNNGGSTELVPMAPRSASTSAALDMKPARIAIYFTVGERKRIDAYNDKKNKGSLAVSTCVRNLVRDALKAEGF